MTDSFVISLYKRLIEDGGFTVHPQTGKPYTGKGYGLSLHKECETVIPLAAEYLFAATLRAFVEQFDYLLTDERAYLGAWVDDEKIYLDISTVCEDSGIAISLARANNQLAVWDFVRQMTIHLDPVPA